MAPSLYKSRRFVNLVYLLGQVRSTAPVKLKGLLANER